MKKTLFLLVLCISTMAYAQEPTALVQIEMKSASGATITTMVVEMPTYAKIFDATNSNTYFPYTSNSENVNLYTMHETNMYGEYGAQTIINVPLGFMTDRKAADKQTYTFTFTVPVGRTLKLWDKVLNDTIDMVNGASYQFTVNTTNCPSYVAGQNIAINDRFVIEPAPFTPDEGEWYGCMMEDNKLYIYNNPYSANIVITDVTGAEVKSVAPTATPQTIDLSGFTAGNYNVILGGGQKELVINVK